MKTSALVWDVHDVQSVHIQTYTVCITKNYPFGRLYQGLFLTNAHTDVFVCTARKQGNSVKKCLVHKPQFVASRVILSL